MSDTPDAPKAGSSPWVGSTGYPAHPNSPLGGGGPGNFVTGNRTTGAPGNDGDAVPHPLSPNGRHHLLGQNDVNALHDEGVPLDTNVTVTGGPKKPNAPPVTKVETVAGAKRLTTAEEIEIKIEVLADKTGSSEVSADGAGLKVGWKGADPQPPSIITDANGMATAYEGPGGKPDATGKMRYKRTVTLQIHYGTSVSTDALSAYGRGTTDADKSSNDTSIGFHENCHLQAALAYFKDSTKLPAAFTGKFKTQKGTDFVKAQQDWLDSFDSYLSKEKGASELTVDEVGNPKLSDYVKLHAGHVH